MPRHARLAFLVASEPRHRGFWEAFAVVCNGYEQQELSQRPRARFFGQHLPASYWPQRGLFSSVGVHFAVLLLVFAFPFHLFGIRSQAKATPQPGTYDLKKVDIGLYLPRLRAPGPGGRPGRGTDPTKLPRLGSTAFHPRQTIVSNPPRPDNTRQTIIQPASPPDLIIPYELRLPNVVLGTSAMLPKHPRRDRLGTSLLAKPPKVKPATVAFAAPSAPSPAIPIPPSPTVNLLARLTVSLPPPPSEPGSPASGDGKIDTPSPDRQWSVSDGPGLLILGVEPGPPTSSLSLPPGNRYGDFSISPAGGQPGSPGGVPGGSLNGGSGGPGTGGDGSSTGVGRGDHGGGGGNFGAPNVVTISGDSGGAGMSGGTAAAGGGPATRLVLRPSLASSLVYPVGRSLRVRRGTLTVTAGPIGGGGLRVYGVLQGGKIYSVYLPMPGKNWVLQYCSTNQPTPTRPAESRAVAAKLDYGLIPPTPREQFDFHRPPVPPDKAHEFIVLHGTLREDGSIKDLRVLRGVDPVADEAAMAAFSQWKFDPALREAKPVALNILVGVPATVPRAPGAQDGAPAPTAERRGGGQ